MKKIDKKKLKGKVTGAKIVLSVIALTMALAMVLGDVSPVAEPIVSEIKAMQSVTNVANDFNVRIEVPETIYLTPNLTSASVFNYYVNNKLDASGNQSLFKEASQTTGKIYFYCPNAVSVSVKVEGVSSCSGDAGTYSTGVTKVLNDGFGEMSITSGTLSSGLAQKASTTIKWTFSYSVNGTTYTNYKYTTCYAPYCLPIGATSVAKNTYDDDCTVSVLSYWSGAHSMSSSQPNISSEGQSLGDDQKYLYPKTKTKDSTKYFIPLTDGIGTTQLGTYWGWDWTTEDTQTGVTEKTIRHTKYESYQKSNWVSCGATSKIALITVDTSRNTNLNQIPNLQYGSLLTDCQDINYDKYYEVSKNYTDDAIDKGFKSDGGHNQYLWPSYSVYTFSSDKNDYTEGTYSSAGWIVEQGSFDRAISGSSYVQFIVKTGAQGHRWSGNIYACSMTYCPIGITCISKSNLRAKVREAINSKYQQEYYSSGWDTFDTALKNACYYLGKPDATGTEVSNATTALTNAMNDLSTKKTGTATVKHLSTAGKTLETEATCTYSYGDTVTVANKEFTGYTYSYYNSDYNYFNVNDFIKWSYSRTGNNISGVAVDNNALKVTASSGGDNYTSMVSGAAWFNKSLYIVDLSPGDSYQFTYNASGNSSQAFMFPVTSDWLDGHGDSYPASYATGDVTVDYTVVSNVGHACFRFGNQSGGTTTTFSNIAVRKTKGLGTGETYYNVKCDAFNVNFYYTPKTYAVTLDSQGAWYAGTTSVTATYDAALPKITDLPKRDGYTFDGYYTAENGDGTQIYKANGESAITEWKTDSDVTLYAKWTPITYTVAFANGNNDATGSMTNKSVTYDTAFNPDACGYELHYTVGINYNKGTGSTDVKVDGNIVNYEEETLTATFLGWEDNNSFTYKGTAYAASTFNAPYYANNTASAIDQIGYDKWALIDNCKATGKNSNGTNKNYYLAEELYPTDEATPVALKNLSTTAGSTVTLTARWELAEITLPTPSRTGYTFGGWSTTNGGKKVYSGGEKITPTANMQLYAIWTAKTYTITFESYGNIHGNDALTTEGTKTITATFDQPYPTITAPAKTGYEFQGYFTENSSNNGSGTKVYNANGTSASGNWTNDGNKTYYAQWNAITYTVIYHGNGATYKNSANKEKYTASDNCTYVNALTTTGSDTFTYDANKVDSGDYYSESRSYNDYSAAYNNNKGKALESRYEKKYISTYDYYYKEEVFDAKGNEMVNDYYEVRYTFKGWATSQGRADAGYVDRVPGAEENLATTNGDVINLYAVWGAAETDTTLTAPAVDKDGLTFYGWYTFSNFSVVETTENQYITEWKTHTREDGVDYGEGVRNDSEVLNLAIKQKQLDDPDYDSSSLYALNKNSYTTLASNLISEWKSGKRVEGVDYKEKVVESEGTKIKQLVTLPNETDVFEASKALYTDDFYIDYFESGTRVEGYDYGNGSGRTDDDILALAIKEKKLSDSGYNGSSLTDEQKATLISKWKAGTRKDTIDYGEGTSYATDAAILARSKVVYAGANITSDNDVFRTYVTNKFKNGTRAEGVDYGTGIRDDENVLRQAMKDKGLDYEDSMLYDYTVSAEGTKLIQEWKAGTRTEKIDYGEGTGISDTMILQYSIDQYHGGVKPYMFCEGGDTFRPEDETENGHDFQLYARFRDITSPTVTFRNISCDIKKTQSFDLYFTDDSKVKQYYISDTLPKTDNDGKYPSKIDEWKLYGTVDEIVVPENVTTWNYTKESEPSDNYLKVLVEEKDEESYSYVRYKKHVEITKNDDGYVLHWVDDNNIDHYINTDKNTFYVTGWDSQENRADIKQITFYETTLVANATDATVKADDQSAASSVKIILADSSGFTTVELPDPVRTGYEFKGWSKQQYADDFVPNKKYSTSADITLYARYKDSTVYFDVNHDGISTNLFSVDSDTSTVKDGLTLTYDSSTETFNLKGTQVAEGNTVLDYIPFNVEAGKTYLMTLSVVSGSRSGGGSSVYLEFVTAEGKTLKEAGFIENKYKNFASSQVALFSFSEDEANVVDSIRVRSYNSKTSSSEYKDFKFKVKVEEFDYDNYDDELFNPVLKKTSPATGLTCQYDSSTGIFTLNGKAPSSSASTSVAKVTFKPEPYTYYAYTVEVLSGSKVTGGSNKNMITWYAYHNDTQPIRTYAGAEDNKVFYDNSVAASNVSITFLNNKSGYLYLNAIQADLTENLDMRIEKNSGAVFDNYRFKITIKKISSDNLNLPEDNSTGSSKGVTVTYDKSSDEYTFNGTLTASTGYMLTVPFEPESGKLYIASVIHTDGEYTYTDTSGKYDSNIYFRCLTSNNTQLKGYNTGTTTILANRERSIGYNTGTATSVWYFDDDTAGVTAKIGVYIYKRDKASNIVFDNFKVKFAVREVSDSVYSTIAHNVTGNSDTLPAAPTRYGYTFAGWYDKSVDGTKIGDANASYSTANLANDTTYYAHWTANTFTVKYVGNGSTAGTEYTQTLTYDQTQTLDANKYKREFTVTYDSNLIGVKNPDASVAKATFNGWALSTSADVSYTNGQTLLVNELYDIAKNSGNVITFYAKWTDGSVTLANATATGATLSGWYTGIYYYPTYTPPESALIGGAGQEYTPTKNITVYGYWINVQISEKSAAYSFGTGSLFSVVDSSDSYPSYYTSFKVGPYYKNMDRLGTATTSSMLRTDWTGYDYSAEVVNGYLYTIKLNPGACEEKIELYYEIQLSKSTYIGGKVTFIPSNNVYYEEDEFITQDSVSEGGENYGTDWSQVTSRGSTSNYTSHPTIYGYSHAYDSNTAGQYSDGSAWQSTVSSSLVSSKTKEFDFNGTAFDLYSECGTDTAPLMVTVWRVDGEDKILAAQAIVDTYLEDTNLLTNGMMYQTPVYHFNAAEYGKYIVQVNAVYLSEIYTTGNTTMDCLTNELEDMGIAVNEDILELEWSDDSSPLAFIAEDADVEEVTETPETEVTYDEDGNEIVTVEAEQQRLMAEAPETRYGYIDGIRVYKTLEDESMYDENEKNAMFYNILQCTRSDNSDALYTEYETTFGSNTGNPQNEIYLAYKCGTAFCIKGFKDSGVKVHLSMRAVKGTPIVNVGNGKGETYNEPRPQGTEMYYDITDLIGDNGMVYVKNTCSGTVLAICNIKITTADGSTSTVTVEPARIMENDSTVIDILSRLETITGDEPTEDPTDEPTDEPDDPVEPVDLSTVTISGSNSAQVKWRYHANLTASATLPEGYSIRWFDASGKAVGNTTGAKATLQTGEMKSDTTYYAKIVDNTTGKPVAGSAEKEVKISVKNDFFTKIISFFMVLFGKNYIDI